jgi:hypothetical protein
MQYLALAVLMLGILPAPTCAQKVNPKDQMPEAVRGVKVYKIPTKGGQPEPNFGIYKKLSFRDMNFERLRLELTVSIRPVDHPATVEHIYFQSVHVNGIPVQIETFDQEFKLSNKESVDVPAPLQCSIVFSDLDSLQPVRDLVDKNNIVITGQSFVEVKLSRLETLAERAKQLVIPVPLNETVQLDLFQGNPVLHMTAATILDNLVNPTSVAAIAMAKEHLAKLTQDSRLGAKANSALYLLLTEYEVRDPKTNAAEQFSQSGTGFLVSADGKLLTTKRVVAPWRFDPQVDLLIEHQHMKVEKDSVKIYAWPAGARVTGSDGQPDFTSALSTEKQSVRILRMPPDELVQQDYTDPDSQEKATLHLNAEGVSDLALLQLTGANFQPLAVPDSAASLVSDSKLVLCSYPLGISQPQSTPRLLSVKVSPQGNMVTIGHKLEPGESGAPLLDSEGRVVALVTSADQGIAVQAAQRLIP